MARMYIDFEINLPDTSEKVPSPIVDYITFFIPDKGYYMQVDCHGESESGVKAGTYGARFKGLESQLETVDETIHEWEDLTEDEFELLRGAKLDALGLYIYEQRYAHPLKPKNLEVEIEFGEKKLSFSSEGDFALDIHGESSGGTVLIMNEEE